MPTKKQRRRRHKSLRHEYEYVYVDAEGREVAVDEAEADANPAPSPRQKETDAKRKKQPSPAARPGRAVQPPSWGRVGRRALIFAPIMFITVALLGKHMTRAQQVMQTVILLVFFLPFSYLMDTLIWRSYRKRMGLADDQPARRR